MTEATTTRRNIALTGPATIAAGKVMDRFPFGQMMDAARAGVAYAINKGLTPARPADFRADGTNWNVGSIDPSGQMRDLVQILFPEECAAADPYRVVETLMSLGISQLAADIEADPSLRLSDILQVAS